MLLTVVDESEVEEALLRGPPAAGDQRLVDIFVSRFGKNDSS